MNNHHDKFYNLYELSRLGDTNPLCNADKCSTAGKYVSQTTTTDMAPLTAFLHPHFVSLTKQQTTPYISTRRSKSHQNNMNLFNDEKVSNGHLNIKLK